MILSAHAVAGATIALTFTNNPQLGLTLALLSHFVLDAVPHWHYPIKQLKRKLADSTGYLLKLNNGEIKDLIVVGTDFVIGIGISALAGLRFAPADIYLAIAGAVLGTIPDFFQLLYFLFPVFPFAQIQRFHMRIHAGKQLDDRYLLGISGQILIIALGIFIIRST